MARRYVVAIVGRPNVGKSALFNRIVGASSSIVHRESGVTRDRLYGTARWRGREFTLLDTGGLDLSSDDDLVQAIRRQVEQAIKESDALLFVVDSKAGLTAQDAEVADVLRKTRKPLIVVANKVDAPSKEAISAEFYGLGFDSVVPVSAAHGLGVGDLLDLLLDRLSESYGEEPVEAEQSEEEPAGQSGGPIRVAIVGKPNVGKSSLVNALLGDERMTVSERPGTTVDAVDTPFRWDGTDFVLVDTAGLRRPKAIEEKLEELSAGRALSAVKRADVAILVVDATSQPSAQERRIAGYIRRNAKASVLVVNKVDLGFYEGVEKAQFKAAVLYECRPIDYSEVLFLSCLTGEGVGKVLPEVRRAYQAYSRRIETSLVNQVVSEIAGLSPPPKEARIYYATQVGEKPPRMVFFVRDPAAVTEMYQRYLENEMRKRFDMKGVPIVMEFRKRERRARQWSPQTR